MKTQELKNLIREEIRKILAEDEQYVIGTYSREDITRLIDTLENINNEIENAGPRSTNIDYAIDDLNDLLN